MFFVESPLFVNWEVVHIEFIHDIVGSLDGPAEHGRVNFVECEASLFDQVGTLFGLFDAVRGQRYISPSCPFLALIPNTFSVSQDD